MAGNDSANADKVFAKIALKNNLVNQDQVKEALALVQKGSAPNLATVLLKKGIINEGHVKAILKKVAERSASSEGTAATPVKKGGPPPREGMIAVSEIEKMDFSNLVGKPIGEYLKRARELGASDFHYQMDSPPFVRVHGHLIKLTHPVLTAADTERAIIELVGEEKWQEVQKLRDYNLSYEKESHGRYRTNILRQRKGWDIVARVIPDKVPSLESLHLPAHLKEFTLYRQGLVLVTGPAGCGKSSTMAALIDLVNRSRHDHIITVEEPIEYLFESLSCNVNQRHVEVHTESFASALRSAMRADPDVIMVGEMRDLETMSMAITAAETGHLVIGTLHTTNAIRSIDRVIDVFPPKEQDQIRAMVSESLRGIVSQQLIPRADGLGREPAIEVMYSTSAVGNMIRENKTFQLHSVLQTGRSRGMCTMDDSIKDLLNKGVITLEQAKYCSEDPNSFK